MDPRESNVEEGPDVVDGDARRLQDGAPHAHLPVLHAHCTHLASGRKMMRESEGNGPIDPAAIWMI